MELLFKWLLLLCQDKFELFKDFEIAELESLGPFEALSLDFLGL